MIEIQKLSKKLGTQQVLDNITLTVPKGSVYGLVGPNGAGKSTLIRHLTGLYRPDSGRITIDGQTVFDNPGIQSRMLCIYDENYYYLHATTKDLMKLYSRLYPRFDRERYAKLKDIFTEVDENTPLRRLSKGMLRQSAFWLSMSCRPEVLVLDEPVDGLDPIMRRQIWSILMGDVAEHETTVLLSSHNLRELEDVCDHVGILHHGRVLLERSLSELQDNISKIQLLLPETEAAPALPETLDIMHRSSTGRMQTLIIRGNPEAVISQLELLKPVYLESIPLTLEEIFIYELGGMQYEVQDILV